MLKPTSLADGYYELNMSDYLVQLEKPIGLTLAPDPCTGKVNMVAGQGLPGTPPGGVPFACQFKKLTVCLQILVQEVHENTAAAKCQLIQVCLLDHGMRSTAPAPCSRWPALWWPLDERPHSVDGS